MKNILIILLLSSIVLFSQNASQYLPLRIGNNWIHNHQALDSLSNPTGPVVPYRTTSIAYQSFLGKQTLINITGIAGQQQLDTSFLAPEGTHVFSHVSEFKLDTINIGGNLPDWLDIYRLANTINVAYLIHQVDTSITLDSTTVPIRVKFNGKRLANESVITPFANFNNCLKFDIYMTIQLKITLPPPLPPYYQDLFSIHQYEWIADSTWIVKSFRPSVDTTIALINQRIRIPGRTSELIFFGTTQCLDVDFNQGWNLVSVPFAKLNMSKDNLFPTSISSAYTYNNGYIGVDTLRNAKGYWLKFANAGTENICGEKVTSGFVPVAAGWNLIGPFSNKIPVSSIISIPPNNVASSFYGYNNGYQVADTLKPGKGYWVKTNQNGQLTIGTIKVK